MARVGGKRHLGSLTQMNREGKISRWPTLSRRIKIVHPGEEMDWSLETVESFRGRAGVEIVIFINEESMRSITSGALTGLQGNNMESTFSCGV